LYAETKATAEQAWDTSWNGGVKETYIYNDMALLQQNSSKCCDFIKARLIEMLLEHRAKQVFCVNVVPMKQSILQ